jgi:uncharacterized protein DUF3883
MPLLVSHIGWMNRYEGLEGKPDKIVGGGRWVQEHGSGGEVCNFLRCPDGYVYGHFETVKKNIDRPVSIELLGADERDESVGGVDVVWTATHPQERRRRVIGWYRDAEVFRERQRFPKPLSKQHKHDELRTYRVRAKASKATLLPLEERTLALGRGPGWPGQANWWFPERSKNSSVKSFMRKVRALMEGSEALRLPPRGRGKGGWGGSRDPERNAEVERAAIAVVENYYAAYSVKSVEDENLGWDLEASAKNKPGLRLEVKGLFSSELTVGLTPREYLALSDHIKGNMPNYRLCVVTGALSKVPRLAIFRYEPKKSGWIDERTAREIRLGVRTLEAAIVSLR